jgi:hypothetical protein
MPPQTLGNPRIEGQMLGDTPEDMRQALDQIRQSTQFWMERIYNHLDQLAGFRGTPTFHADVDVSGNRVTGLGAPVNPTDAERVDFSLRSTKTSGPFDAQDRGIMHVAPAEELHQAVNLEQLRNEMATMEGFLKNEPFVTAAASTPLTAERTLAAQVGVTTITDNGANSTIVAGIAANGIGNTQLRQGGATSVIGRAANSTGNVADIAASGDNQVLARTSGALGFTDTPTVTSISFGDEALDTYDEGTFTATGKGFVVNPTGTAEYVRIGRFVALWLPELTGTSNLTTFTVTGMPAGIQPTNQSYQLARMVDNGVEVVGLIELVGASSTITLYASSGGAAWTAAGTKTLQRPVITYILT